MTITVNLNGWILILFSALLAGDIALNIIYLFLKLKGRHAAWREKEGAKNEDLH